MRDGVDVRVDELRAWNDSGKEYVLLDVREPAECELASIAGAMRVPMREVPARIAEIPPGKPVVVMCHHGERSAVVARFLAGSGFTDVHNLAGGIDAYAAFIDPEIARY